MTDRDQPESIIDTEREEARDAREHEPPGEPGMWSGGRWTDLPERWELDEDARR